MSNVRMRYWEIAPEGIAKMRELEHYVNASSGLDHGLLELIRLRASILNGCNYCIDMHTTALKKLNETPERMDVASWRSSQSYTRRERAALSWTEAVTNIQDGHAPEAIYNEVCEVFSERETVDLTLAITTINAWNRMAISLGSHATHEAVS